MISVLLVDDHPVVIEGLRKVLATAGDLLVSVIRSGTFQLNEIVRIAGPFADLPGRSVPASPTR